MTVTRQVLMGFLNREGSCVGVGKWSQSGYILNINPCEFSYQLDRRCEKEEKSSMNS